MSIDGIICKRERRFGYRLVKRGYTTREIAKMAHVPFTYIKKIKQKLTGEVKLDGDDKRNKPLSLVSGTQIIF